MDLFVSGSFGLSNATFTDAATNEPRFRTSSKRMQWGNHWDTTLYAIPTGTPNASRYVADDMSEDTLVAEEDPAKFADLEIIGTLHLATYYTDSGHTLIVNSRDITPKRVHMLTTCVLSRMTVSSFVTDIIQRRDLCRFQRPRVQVEDRVDVGRG